MTQEKRQTLRKRIGRLLYAELGPDNGSILLDISEQGCSFQAIAPVRENQVHFTISVGDGRKVTGEARVAWVDATAKIGGLRFLTDSPELQEQIRTWMELTAAPLSAWKAGEERDSEAKRRRKKLREEAYAQPGTGEAGRSTQLPASLNRIPAATTTERTSARDSSIPNLQAQSANRVVFQVTARNPTRVGPAFAIIALAAVLFTMMAYHQDLGRMVMGLGASIAGEPRKPPALPPSATSEPDASSNLVGPAGAPDSSGESHGIESESSGKGQLTPVAEGRDPLGRPVTAANASLSEDVPSLWTLVEGGDTRAELTLADRYIRGEGVIQNCAQARVLLEAAAKRGSDEAKRKLNELPQAGCR